MYFGTGVVCGDGAEVCYLAGRREHGAGRREHGAESMAQKSMEQRAWSRELRAGAFGVQF